MILEERVKPEMHQSVVEIGTGVCQNIKEAKRRSPHDPPADHHPGAAERTAPGGRRHASLRAVERSGDLSGRPLPRDCGRPEDGGARQPDLRTARAHRRGGSRDRDPTDERRALLPAASAGALREFAVLAGHGDRTALLPLQGVRQVPAHQHPGPLLQLERIRELRQSADSHQLHRQRQEDLVGHPPASLLPHARIPRLRHADAAGGEHRDRGAVPGDHRQALPACTSETRASATTAARSSWRTSGAPRATGWTER